VSARRDAQFQISNAAGFINGWITRTQIHGRLIRIQP
jgi:hypothetical protein